MITAILTVLAMFSASLHIHAEYHGPRRRVYLFKPLTMIFILLIALQAGKPEALLYKYAIIAGLVCSLAGDVFLMLPSDRFIAGLASFLIAHLFYIAAFASEAGFGLSLWSLAPLVIYGIVMLRILSPHLGEMKAPVLVYMMTILVMVWQAWERWSQVGQSRAERCWLSSGRPCSSFQIRRWPSTAFGANSSMRQR